MPATETQSTLRCRMKPNCSLNVHGGRLSHSRDMPVAEVWHLASTGEMFVERNGTNRKMLAICSSDCRGQLPSGGSL